MDVTSSFDAEVARLRQDMPLALRTAGRWIGKVRKMSAHFRAGIDTMVREAELEEMEKKWKEQNAAIMRDHPQGTPTEMEPTGAWPPKPPVGAEAKAAETPQTPAQPAQSPPEAPAKA